MACHMTEYISSYIQEDSHGVIFPIIYHFLLKQEVSHISNGIVVTLQERHILTNKKRNPIKCKMTRRAKARFSSPSYSLPSVEILSFQIICYELTSMRVLIYSLSIQIYFLSYIKHTYSFCKCVESHWTISIIMTKHFNSLSLHMTARVFFKKYVRSCHRTCNASWLPSEESQLPRPWGRRVLLPLLSAFFPSLPHSPVCLATCSFSRQKPYASGFSVWKVLPTVTLRVHTPYKSLLKWYLNYLPWWHPARGTPNSLDPDLFCFLYSIYGFPI